VEMHDPNWPVRLYDDQRGNFRLVEKLQCLARQLVRTDGFGRGGHYRVDRGLQQIPSHMTAQVAVGDDAGQFSGSLDDGDTAEAFGGHFNDRFRHRSAAPNQRHSRAWMHDVADELQRCAKLAARMKHAEIDGSEAATFK